MLENLHLLRLFVDNRSPELEARENPLFFISTMIPLINKGVKGPDTLPVKDAIHRCNLFLSPFFFLRAFIK